METALGKKLRANGLSTLRGPLYDKLQPFWVVHGLSFNLGDGVSFHRVYMNEAELKLNAGSVKPLVKFSSKC